MVKCELSVVLIDWLEEGCFFFLCGGSNNERRWFVKILMSEEKLVISELVQWKSHDIQGQYASSATGEPTTLKASAND